jgi:hypothetical protein
MKSPNLKFLEKYNNKIVLFNGKDHDLLKDASIYMN